MVTLMHTTTFPLVSLCSSVENIEKDLVILNDGSGTRVDLVRSTESCLEITVVSQCLASRSTWKK